MTEKTNPISKFLSKHSTTLAVGGFALATGITVTLVIVNKDHKRLVGIIKEMESAYVDLANFAHDNGVDAAEIFAHAQSNGFHLFTS